MNQIIKIAPSIILTFAFASCQTFSSNSKNIVVILQSKSNSQASGKIMLQETANGNLYIEGKITGLDPNSIHGFHFHEKGDCSDKEALNAGGHFNPDKDHSHGISVANAPYVNQHAGDLGNIKANNAGIAFINLTISQPKFTLSKEGKYSLFRKSIVVHANADDEKSAPAGNAGVRILCGVIK